MSKRNRNDTAYAAFKEPMELRKLGTTPLQVSPLGLGTWAWGDRRYWGYGKDFGLPDVKDAYRVSIDAGVNFFDTAEIYGSGESERILGSLIGSDRARMVIATKFAPYPWRFRARSLHEALDASLRRLGVAQVDLYQIHFPLSAIRFGPLMDALADAVAGGKAKSVGVSNYSASQMRRAHEALARRGVALASNQVEYSLLRRDPELNGVLEACRELNVSLIAYSPLAQGILTEKYHHGATVSGMRRYRGRFRGGWLKRAAGIVALLESIGRVRGKTPGQVALNWLIRKPGVIPIPGAKNRQQAAENAGAMGWELSDEEIGSLDNTSAGWRG